MFKRAGRVGAGVGGGGGGGGGGGWGGGGGGGRGGGGGGGGGSGGVGWGGVGCWGPWVGGRGWGRVGLWVWALEDCRHVSGSFERFLLVHGERVVRVATRLMAGERRSGRARGKSDLIDALAVARAALREGLDRLPVAELAGVELDIRLLVDHRERLVRMRTALYNDLLWHLHDLWPEQTFPKCALLSKKWATTIGRRLARTEQTARVGIARDELRHL